MKLSITFLIVLLGSIGFSQTTHAILVGSNGFNPENLTVEAGDIIHFTLDQGNNSGIHTSTSTSVPNGENTWDHEMNCGFCLYTVVPNTVGIYEYQDQTSGLTGSFEILGTPSSIDEIEKEFSMSPAHPNPATSSTIIEYDGLANEGQLKLVNLAGQVVSESDVVTKAGRVEVTNVNVGVYFYWIESGDFRSEVRRIVFF